MKIKLKAESINLRFDRDNLKFIFKGRKFSFYEVRDEKVLKLCKISFKLTTNTKIVLILDEQFNYYAYFIIKNKNIVNAKSNTNYKYSLDCMAFIKDQGIDYANIKNFENLLKLGILTLNKFMYCAESIKYQLLKIKGLF